MENRKNSRVALYARVSTTDKGQDPQMQLREMREYAEQQGLTVVTEYVDNGVSGAKESRPELNRMMADARARKFGAGLVWKIDRFGRSLKHLVNALADLADWNVAFVSLKDNLDLNTPGGRLMFQMVAAFAEFEREMTRERVRGGLRNARAKGKRLGRPEIAVDAILIANLRQQGKTWAQIATETGISERTCYRAANAAKQI